MARRADFLACFATAAVLLGACAEEEAEEAPPVTSVPAECAKYPRFETARARAEGKLGPMMGGPAALVEAERVTLYATAVNARAEPAVERFVCPRP